MNIPLLTPVAPAASDSSERVITRSNVADWLADLDVPLLSNSEGTPPNNVVQLPKVSTPAIGVFSNTRMYAAFIQSELADFPVQMHCVLHPDAYHPARYAQLDSASAWILCLTGEETAYESFLDAFLDRYGDRNVLYMFNTTTRTNTSEKIQGFVKQLFT